MRRLGLFWLGLALAAPVGADEVLLRGGGKVSGVIVERTASSIVVEVGPGLVTLPLARVLSIQEGPSALATFRERASRLAGGDVAGWLALGEWARQHDLSTQAHEAFARALALDPANAEANEALGRVPLGDHWVSLEEANRARGLILFNGRWMTLAEQEAQLRQEQADEAAAQARQESDARAREAEARAREAEARAQAAEAQAEAAYGMGTGYAGVPYLPYGGVLYGSPFVFRHPRLRHQPVSVRPIRMTTSPATRRDFPPTPQAVSQVPSSLPRRLPQGTWH